MSSNKPFSTETSERYSRALFEVANEADELERVEIEVKNFYSIFNSSEEIKNFVQNPTHSIESQNGAIQLISDKLGFSKNFKNFLYLLIEKRRIFFIKKIFQSFLKLCSNKRGEISASLISSKELSEVQLNEISEDLSKSMGLKIRFNYKVDKELIGGLKLQLGSLMVDTSIKNKLKKYKQAMLER